MIRKIAAASALAWCCSAGAVDGVSLEYGRGDQHSDLWRLGLRWDWKKKHRLGPYLQWGGYWEASGGQWANGERVTDLAFTPVFRLERSEGSYLPYLEGAIGLHLLSQVNLSEHRTSGTHFQFGDHVGIGVRFGERLQHDIGIRAQHLSNAGIGEPNPGIDFVILRYEYRFR
jgi:hypothetical protein